MNQRTANRINGIKGKFEKELENLINRKAADVRILLYPKVARLRVICPDFFGIVFGMGTHAFLGQTSYIDAEDDLHDEPSGINLSEVADHDNYVTEPAEIGDLVREIEEIIQVVNCDDFEKVYHALESFYFGPDDEILNYQYFTDEQIKGKLLGEIKHNDRIGTPVRLDYLLSVIWTVVDKQLLQKNLNELIESGQVVNNPDQSFSCPA
jgi:hypothetical protein